MHKIQKTRQIASSDLKEIVPFGEEDWLENAVPGSIQVGDGGRVAEFSLKGDVGQKPPESLCKAFQGPAADFVHFKNERFHVFPGDLKEDGVDDEYDGVKHIDVGDTL